MSFSCSSEYMCGSLWGKGDGLEMGCEGSRYEICELYLHTENKLPWPDSTNAMLDLCERRAAAMKPPSLYVLQ